MGRSCVHFHCKITRFSLERNRLASGDESAAGFQIIDLELFSKDICVMMREPSVLDSSYSWKLDDLRAEWEKFNLMSFKYFKASYVEFFALPLILELFCMHFICDVKCLK